MAKVFFDREAGTGLSQRMLTTVTEALLNIKDHSNPDGIPAASRMQIQVLPDAFELAFGDLGRGFLDTLRRSPAHRSLEDESAALTGVLRHRFTRFGNREHRGGGLATAADIAHELGGSIQVLSRDGFARRCPDSDYEFSSIPEVFPGAIVWFRIPRRLA